MPYKDPESALKNVKSRQDRNREFVKSVKAQYGCLICGEKEPVALDLHHVDPETKTRRQKHRAGNGIGWMQSYSIERLQEEMEKCIVLCANCHRKHHAGLIEIPESAETIRF